MKKEYVIGGVIIALVVAVAIIVNKFRNASKTLQEKLETNSEKD